MDKRLAGRRILVVEDEMLLAMFIEELLTDSGCAAVASAATNEQALALVDSGPQPFDVAMLDLNLKGALSYPVADALAARNVPFLFATGYGTHGIHARYRDRPLLQKPFDPNELVGLLAGLNDPCMQTFGA